MRVECKSCVTKNSNMSIYSKLNSGLIDFYYKYDT